MTEYQEIKQILTEHNVLDKSVDEVVVLGTDVYQDIFSYYMNTGDMPYNVAKGHYGNSDEWIADKIYELKILKD